MGDFKKYIRTYLLAYGVFGVVFLIMFGVLLVLEKLPNSHSDVIGAVIAILYSLCFWGVPLCYAFPEFKRKIKLAPVRIIILDLLFCLLFVVFCVVCGIAMIGIYIGPSMFNLLPCIVVSFPFFWFYKFLFYRWFAGEKIKFKKVLIDFGVTIVLSFLFFLVAGLMISNEEEKIEGGNGWLVFLGFCLFLFLLYSLVITDVVRGYFVRKGEVKKPSENMVVTNDVTSNCDNIVKTIDSVVGEEEVASVKEDKIVEKEEKEVIKESELLCVSSGSCGENVSYKLTIDSTLTISGQGPMCDYDYTNKSPFKDMEIHKVIIEKGVTTIGDMAFLGCREMKSLEIADSVVTIGEWSFGYCEKLKSLFIPKSVKLIKCRAFRCCNKSLVVEFAKKVKVIEDNAFDDEVVIKKSRS